MLKNYLGIKLAFSAGTQVGCIFVGWLKLHKFWYYRFLFTYSMTFAPTCREVITPLIALVGTARKSSPTCPVQRRPRSCSGPLANSAAKKRLHTHCRHSTCLDISSVSRSRTCLFWPSGTSKCFIRFHIWTGVNSSSLTPILRLVFRSRWISSIEIAYVSGSRRSRGLGCHNWREAVKTWPEANLACSVGSTARSL
jgi:hypothetical protein